MVEPVVAGIAAVLVDIEVVLVDTAGVGIAAEAGIAAEDILAEGIVAGDSMAVADSLWCVSKTRLKK